MSLHVVVEREDGSPAVSCCSGCRVQQEDLVLKVLYNSESEVRFRFFGFKPTSSFPSLLSCMHALNFWISSFAFEAGVRGSLEGAWIGACRGFGGALGCAWRL